MRGVHWGHLGFSSSLLRACSIEAGLKAHVCLPGPASPPACRGPASPPACPGACLTSSLPGSFLQRQRPPASRAPPARPAALRNRARQTCTLLQRGTSCRSRNPPLTRGDPAEATPPGQSQPSRVHPVKQRAGAMRTRTGTQPSSISYATPVPWICAHLPAGSGGGRHPKTRPTGPPPCGMARQKPPKRRTATPPRIPPPRPLPACSPARWSHAEAVPRRQTRVLDNPAGPAAPTQPLLAGSRSVVARHTRHCGPGLPGGSPILATARIERRFPSVCRTAMLTSPREPAMGATSSHDGCARRGSPRSPPTSSRPPPWSSRPGVPWKTSRSRCRTSWTYPTR